MTFRRPERERLIGALVPVAAERPAPDPAPAAPLPIRAAPVGIPVLAVARLDGSGRVSARPLLQALGWHPGQGVDIDVRHGRPAVTADPRGRYALDPRGLLALPAPLRSLCGLAAGAQVLLAALPTHHLLVVHRADELARLLHPAHQHGGRTPWPLTRTASTSPASCSRSWV